MLDYYYLYLNIEARQYGDDDDDNNNRCKSTKNSNVDNAPAVAAANNDICILLVQIKKKWSQQIFFSLRKKTMEIYFLYRLVLSECQLIIVTLLFQTCRRQTMSTISRA